MYNILSERKLSMSVTDFILNIIMFIMLVVLAWFTFQTANVAVTIFKQRKKDPSMKFCFNSKGRIFYIIATIIFLASYIIGVYVVFWVAIPEDNLNYLRIAVDLVALITTVYAMLISNVIMLGKKEMMIGRMLIDYRKMKKINYGLNDKVSFIFAQKEYSFTTQFTDLKEIRSAIKR